MNVVKDSEIRTGDYKVIQIELLRNFLWLCKFSVAGD